MDIAFGIWLVGAIIAFVSLLIATLAEPPHNHGDFENLYQSWGVARFYTVWFLGWIVACIFWPVMLVGLYITALVKKW